MYLLHWGEKKQSEREVVRYSHIWTLIIHYDYSNYFPLGFQPSEFGDCSVPSCMEEQAKLGVPFTGTDFVPLIQGLECF